MIKNQITLIIISCIFTLPAYSIWNGRSDASQEFENVQKISFQYKDLTDLIIFWGPKKRTSFCTATVIDNHTILTAAHCTLKAKRSYQLEINIEEHLLKVDDIYIPKDYTKKYKFWHKLYRKFLRLQQYKDYPNPEIPDQIAYYKNASRNAFLQLTNIDIALIKTKEIIPKSVIRTKLNFSGAEVNDPTISIGFGRTHYSNEQKKWIYPKLPHYRIENISQINNGCIEIFSKSNSDQITTMGDSGGPLLSRDAKEQIGILGGQVNYFNNNSSVYLKFSQKHKNFIQYHDI